MKRGYQRKFLRAPIMSEAILTLDNEVHHVRVLDISQGGASILASKLLGVNECSMLLELKKHPLYFENNNEQASSVILRIKGKILPKLRDVEIQGYQVAIEFAYNDAYTMSLLDEYVKVAQKNLNYLKSLETSSHEALDDFKEIIKENLGWFSHEASYSSKLEHLHRNVQWS